MNHEINLASFILSHSPRMNKENVYRYVVASSLCMLRQLLFFLSVASY